MHTALHKVTIKYVGPVVICKIIDPHNYLLMTLEGRILRETIWTWEIKTCKHKNESRNVQNLEQFRKIMNMGLKISLESKEQLTVHLKGTDI